MLGPMSFGALAGAGGAAPDAPTGLTAAAVSTSQIDLAWTNNHVDADGIKVYRSSDGVTFAELDNIAANFEAYNDTFGTAGTMYWYYVAAYNASGESASNTAAANTLLLNLISFWELEEASGARLDAHGNNDLADNNTVTQSAGKVGNAAQFTAATTEFLSITDNADLSMGDIDFSISGWVYLDTIGVFHGIISKYASDTNREYLLWVPSNNTVQFLVYNGAAGGNIGAVAASTFGALAAETWYFVYAHHDAINNQLMVGVNGTTNTAATTGAPGDSNGPFRLGYAGTSAAYMNGRIDQLSVSKRLLTTDERASLYNSGNGRSYAYLVGDENP